MCFVQIYVHFSITYSQFDVYHLLNIRNLMSFSEYHWVRMAASNHETMTNEHNYSSWNQNHIYNNIESEEERRKKNSSKIVTAYQDFHWQIETSFNTNTNHYNAIDCQLYSAPLGMSKRHNIANNQQRTMLQCKFNICVKWCISMTYPFQIAQ